MTTSIETALARVCAAFNIPGEIVSAEIISQGNVNGTYRVTCRQDGKEKQYLLQRINTYVFPQPWELMQNIQAVTQHIRAKRPGQTCLRFYETADGKPLADVDGLWRVCDFIPSVTFDSGKDLDVVRSAGEAFGDFQAALDDLDARRLFATIKRFHHTRARFESLEKAAAQAFPERLAESRETLDWLRDHREQACMLSDLGEAGLLPLRVTHNDTKINNVLFDPETRQAMTVIDLDTVMPGLAGFDFGDAIRSAGNYVEEDSEPEEKAGLDLDVFRAFSEGYFGKMGKSLTEREIDTMPISCFAMTAELSARFLTDYLNGDVYFQVKKPRHNLIRARNQMFLAKDMLLKMEEMDRIVRACI